MENIAESDYNIPIYVEICLNFCHWNAHDLLSIEVMKKKIFRYFFHNKILNITIFS